MAQEVNNMYTLDSIFYEVWKNEHKDDVKRIEEQAKCAYKERDKDKGSDKDEESDKDIDFNKLMEYIMSDKAIMNKKGEKQFIEKQVMCVFNDNKNEYRKKLNAMFKALFGYEYSKVLIGNKQGRVKYNIYDGGRNFIIFLLETHSEKNGQILRSGKFEKCDDSYLELDREYENELLYLLCESIFKRASKSGEWR